MNSGFGVVPRWGQAVARSTWECSRVARMVSRRFGSLGWFSMACVVLSVAAAIYSHHAKVELNEMSTQIAQQGAAAMRSVESRTQAPTSRFSAFEDILLAHADIPSTVEDLLELAQAQHLSITRGDYRPQVDTKGGFMRYRMMLPVKGDAQAIHRFMLAALRTHPTLALESAQFKRERIESPEVEARIQWVVFTRLPSANAQAAPPGAVQRPTP